MALWRRTAVGAFQGQERLLAHLRPEEPGAGRNRVLPPVLIGQQFDTRVPATGPTSRYESWMPL